MVNTYNDEGFITYNFKLNNLIKGGQENVEIISYYAKKEVL